VVTVAILGAVLLVTTVHECGHWAMARMRGAAVISVKLGRGPTLGVFRSDGTEYALALLPLGGRVHCERLESEAANAMIAAAGPAANLLFGFVVLAGAAALLGVDAMPRNGGFDGAAAYAHGTVLSWAGVVFQIIGGWLGISRGPGLGAIARLVEIAHSPGLAPKLYFVAVLSTLWGILNLVPTPVVHSDGWHVAAAGVRRVRKWVSRG